MASRSAGDRVALDPARQIIDPHHHLWSDKAHSLATPYTLTDLERDMTSGHDIVGTVYVECSSRYRDTGPESFRPVGETEFVAALDPPAGALQGIVGFVDMNLGADAAAVLEAHVAAGDGRFKGIRHPVGWDASPDVINTSRNSPSDQLRHDAFRDGVAAVGEAGLLFETWVYFHQLPDLATFAAELPSVPIVLNHLGGPVVAGPYADHRASMLTRWRQGMADLAEQPNVCIKLGGIGFPPFVEESVLAGPRTSDILADYWRDEILFCIETFGPSRCMFESNFPVDSILCDYVTLWNVFKRVAADLGASDQDELFHGTAQRVYSLPSVQRAATAGQALHG
jgi:L-fuconolactonase